MNANSTEKQSDKKTPLIHSVYDFLELLVISICIVFIIFTFSVRLCRVNGPSMENTLYNGEMLLTSDLFYTPTAGDVIVFHQTSEVNPKYNELIVKRIIATEGQRVEIQADGVYVYNPDGTGGKLEESDGSLGYTVSFAPSSPSAYKYHRQTVIVGEGEVFVMGDHRSVSEDSRSFGCVDERCIVGKAYFRVTPFDRIGFLHHN